MKRISLLFSMLFIFVAKAQVVNEYEKYPVFKACDSTVIKELPTCFKNQVQAVFKQEFSMPDVVTKDEYSGSMNILFEVTKEGEFKLLYTKATYAELKEEVEKAFKKFPKVTTSNF